MNFKLEDQKAVKPEKGYASPESLATTSESGYLGKGRIWSEIDRIDNFEFKKVPLRHHTSEALWDALDKDQHSIKVYKGTLSHQVYFGEPLGNTLQNIIPFYYFFGAYFELRPNRLDRTSRSYKFYVNGKKPLILHGCVGHRWGFVAEKGMIIDATLGFVSPSLEETALPNRVFPPSNFPAFSTTHAILKIKDAVYEIGKFEFGFASPVNFTKIEDGVPTGIAGCDYSFEGVFEGPVKPEIDAILPVSFTMADVTGKEIEFVFEAVFNADNTWTGQAKSQGVKDLQVYLRPPF